MEHLGKRYTGARTDAGVTVTVHEADGSSHPLTVRLDLRNHSPDGFNWGCEGSGAAQTALALCADATGDDRLARDVYQSVKRAVVARLSGDSWELTAAQVLDAVRRAERDMPRRL